MTVNRGQVTTGVGGEIIPALPVVERDPASTPEMGDVVATATGELVIFHVRNVGAYGPGLPVCVRGEQWLMDRKGPPSSFSWTLEDWRASALVVVRRAEDRQHEP